MAGDWIKMRVDLNEDPAVVGMAIALDTDEHSVVGRLHKLWSWADNRCANEGQGRQAPTRPRIHGGRLPAIDGRRRRQP